MEFKKYIHFSQELEDAILGACILEKDAFGRTFGIIEKETLYHDGNKIVYEALASMFSNGHAIDLLTVADYIINHQGISEINGFNTPYFVTRLTNSVVSSANLELHAHIIKRMWMEREIIKLTSEGTDQSVSIKEQIFKLSEGIQRINQGSVVSDWRDMSEVVYNLVKHQDEMAAKKGMGITTGIRTLDKENGGFWGGQMIVIGARPSVGKSAFMGQMAIAMARAGTTVGIISMEMNNNEIAARLSSLETDQDFKTIFRNLYKDEDHRADWYNRIKNLTNYPIFISDSTHVDPVEIKAKATKLKHNHNLGCLMIDYLQLISATENNKNRNRENEVSQISRAIKLIAMDLDIPVIVICQLNRESLKRKGNSRFPELSDLRESGSIEQDADVAMFIHRDWMIGLLQDENGNSTENQAHLVIRKWRNGVPNLIIPMHFDGPRMMFKQTEFIQTWKPENVDYTADNPF